MYLNLDVDVDDLKDKLRAGAVDIRLVARANRERLIRSEAEILCLATGQKPADEGQHGLRGELNVERLWVEGGAVEDVQERLVAGFEGQDRAGSFEKVSALEEVSLFEREGGHRKVSRRVHQEGRDAAATYSSEVGRDPDGFDRARGGKERERLR